MANITVVDTTHYDDVGIDGCDIAIRDEDATTDEKLPAAVGGVALPANEDTLDGCDTVLSNEDVTADEALPIADGGVV